MPSKLIAGLDRDEVDADREVSKTILFVCRVLLSDILLSAMSSCCCNDDEVIPRPPLERNENPCTVDGAHARNKRAIDQRLMIEY